MSNPLTSLRKQKKPPLYLPEMPQPTTSASTSSMSNSFNNLNSNSILTPVDKFNENENETRSSPLSSFSTSYPLRNSLSKKLISNEASLSSRVPFKTKSNFKLNIY